MAIRTELRLRLKNSPGALGDVCRRLADASVRILALALDSGGTLRLVVDNPLRASGVLTERDYTLDQRDVLFVPLPNGPGGLLATTRRLATAGINIEHAYGSALDDHDTAAVVVGVDDALRAATTAGS